MKKKLFFTAFSVLMMLSMSYKLISKNNHANIGSAMTGAPSEGTCINCHTGSPLNNGSGGVTITFNGGNNTYVPGQTYTVNVTVTHQAPTFNFGFEMTEINSSNATAGTFVTGLSTTLANYTVGGQARKYIGHGPFPSSTGTWNFQWTAPNTNQGNLTFYVAGNAADQSSTNSGDEIYTSQLMITPAPVNNPPTAVVTVSNNAPCNSAFTTFTGSATAGSSPVVSTFWNFGDGNTQTGGMTASHAYLLAGSYNVLFIATDSLGLHDTAQTAVTVTNCGIQANLILSTDTLCAGDTLFFTDLCSAGGGGSIILYGLSYGDGSPAYTGATPPIPFNHIYTTPGTYFINYGCSNSIAPPAPGIYDSLWTQIVVINCNTITPITSTANSTNGTNLCPYVSNEFTSTVSNGSGTHTTVWSMGDGNFYTNQDTVNHIYNAGGNYNVVLTVVDPVTNDTSTSIINVNVTNFALANAGADQTICAGNSVQIGMPNQFSTLYGWSPMSSGLSNDFISDPIASPTVTTTYILTTLDSATTICMSLDSMVVTVNACTGPSAALNIPSISTLCAGNTLSVTDISMPNTGPAIDTIYTDFGDGSPAVMFGLPFPAPYTHTYTTAGTYTITHIAYNASTSSPSSTFDTTTYTVVVLPCLFNTSITAPSVSPFTTCIGSTVGFAASSVNGTPGYNYNWDFANGFTANTANATTSYNTAGTYVVMLIGSDQANNFDTVYTTIIVSNGPGASAGVDTAKCQGSTSTLIIGSPALPNVNYSWSPTTGLSTPFNSFTVANPTSTTSYIVTATDNTTGCVSKDTMIFSVLPPPTVTISASNTSPCAGQAVTFTSNAVGGSLGSYTWNIGAATIVSGTINSPSITLSWPSLGLQTVSLFAVSSLGCNINIPPITISVINCNNVPPVANFSDNTWLVSPCTGNLITFTDASVNTPTSWSWNFGAAATPSTSTLQNPSVSFNSPGVYSVSLTATNAFGSDTYVSQIVISATPTATFTVTSPICVGELGNVIYTGTAPNTAFYSWTFGGGVANPGFGGGPHTVSYTTPGIMTIFLSVTDGLCSASASNTVAVVNNPIASFTSSTTGPGTVSFNNTSAGAASYFWQLSDNSNYTTQNPTHTFALNGIYQVCLTAINGNCRNNYCDTVQIWNLPNVGINSYSDLNMQIYYNATADEMVFNSTEATNVQAAIYNTTGQLLAQNKLVQCKYCTIDTRALPSGVYIVKVQTNTGVNSIKFIKQ